MYSSSGIGLEDVGLLPHWSDRKLIGLWRLLSMEMIVRGSMDAAAFDDAVHAAIPVWPVALVESEDSGEGHQVLTEAGWTYCLLTGRWDPGYQAGTEPEKRLQQRRSEMTS